MQIDDCQLAESDVEAPPTPKRLNSGRRPSASRSLIGILIAVPLTGIGVGSSVVRCDNLKVIVVQRGRRLVTVEADAETIVVDTASDNCADFVGQAWAALGSQRTHSHSASDRDVRSHDFATDRVDGTSNNWNGLRMASGLLVKIGIWNCQRAGAPRIRLDSTASQLRMPLWGACPSWTSPRRSI
jgi:hypothetical protein